MVALIHPLIGGKVAAQSRSNAESDVADETSHFGVITFIPRRFIFETNSIAAFDLTPDLDGKMRCFAPLLTIQLDIDRPIPPKPPATRYEAFISSFQSSGRRMNFYLLLAMLHMRS